MDRDSEVRLIAYHIWEDEGCPDGRECEHWQQAEMIWEVNNKKKAAPAKAASTRRKATTTAKKSTKSTKK